MPFTKGTPKPKGSGIQKGYQKKETIEFKQAVNNLIEWGTPKFIMWMEELDAPEKRLDYVLRFAEYAHPKLARQEVTGADGQPLIPEDAINIEELTRAYTAIIRQAKH
jgi:hypothetical protein